MLVMVFSNYLICSRATNQPHPKYGSDWRQGTCAQPLDNNEQVTMKAKHRLKLHIIGMKPVQYTT